MTPHEAATKWFIEYYGFTDKIAATIADNLFLFFDELGMKVFSRDPTEAMEDAADEEYRACEQRSRDRNAERGFPTNTRASYEMTIPVWRAMFDAA